MSFMEPEIIHGTWYEIETNNGTWFVPVDLIGEPENNFEEKLVQYTEGTKVYSWNIKEGYGARLSARGYLDCTDWSVFDTEEEAREFLIDTYDVEENEFD